MFAIPSFSPWTNTYTSYSQKSFQTSPSPSTSDNVRFFTSMTTNTVNLEKSPSSGVKAERPQYAHSKPRQPAYLKSPSKRRELRNAVLLKGVKDRRQNARDDLRSDYILRSDMLAEQKAWEQAQEIEAAKWLPREDEMDEQPDDPELEDYLRREEEELQARAAEQMQAQEKPYVDGFGSDDEDFDMLFLEAIAEFEQSQDGDRGMDIS